MQNPRLYLPRSPERQLRPREIRDSREDRFLFEAMLRARRGPLTRQGSNQFAKAFVKSALRPMYEDNVCTLLIAKPSEEKR